VSSDSGQEHPIPSCVESLVASAQTQPGSALIASLGGLAEPGPLFERGVGPSLETVGRHWRRHCASVGLFSARWAPFLEHLHDEALVVRATIDRLPTGNGRCRTSTRRYSASVSGGGGRPIPALALVILPRTRQSRRVSDELTNMRCHRERRLTRFANRPHQLDARHRRAIARTRQL
jgi:hypothetical protein